MAMELSTFQSNEKDANAALRKHQQLSDYFNPSHLVYSGAV